MFPLVPKFRVSGLPFGGVTSLRRGHGSDVAGSRAYVRGDPLSTIDWRASARLSTARGRDEFVVRERYAEEAARVVVLCDYSPSMALYAPPYPWLSKPAVVRSATELIVQSALAGHAAVAYLDFAGADERDGNPYWIAAAGARASTRSRTRQRDARSATTLPPRVSSAGSSSSRASAASSRRGRSSSSSRTSSARASPTRRCSARRPAAGRSYR